MQKQVWCGYWRVGDQWQAWASAEVSGKGKLQVAPVGASYQVALRELITAYPELCLNALVIRRYPGEVYPD